VTLNDPITLSDPRWEGSYPNVPTIRAGQSLPGYCLELDQANDLDPGFTFRLIRRVGTGPAHLAAPGKWLSAYLMDINRLALLTARPHEELEMLTARPLMRWLYPAAATSGLIGSQLLGQRLSFALCPRCVESADLPMAGLFAFTVGCPRHGVRLQAACASRIRLRSSTDEICATPITLFSGADRFYACPRLECGASYTVLPAIALTHDEHAHARAVTRLLEDLLCHAAHAKALGPGFGNSLRAAFQRSELPDGRAITLGTALRAPRPSLPALIEALIVTKTSVEDWLMQQRDPRNALPAAKAVGRAARDLKPLFPSPHHPACPSCDGAEAFRNGRAATLDRSQEFICKRCGTRFTRWQVLFSFDPHQRYREVLAARNQGRLDRCRQAVRSVLAAWPADVRMTRTAVFARAGVPRAISYTTQRAGLAQMVEAERATRFAASLARR
jgi:hypothetical protein